MTLYFSRRAAVQMALAIAVATLPHSRTAAQHATPAASDVAGALTPAAGTPQVRKNAKTLSAAERQAFVNAVLALKRKPSPWMMGLSVYDTFVLWHRDIFACSLHFAHHRPLFLPWHRMFTRLFEQQLQAIEPTVAIPYWDWTVNNTPDAYLWQDDLLGGNGDPGANYAVVTGPFAMGKWTFTVLDYGADQRRSSIVRNFGSATLAPTLPTAADVEAAMSIATYDVAPWNSTAAAGTSFRNALKGYRDCVNETCDPVNGMTPTCTTPPISTTGSISGFGRGFCAGWHSGHGADRGGGRLRHDVGQHLAQ